MKVADLPDPHLYGSRDGWADDGWSAMMTPGEQLTWLAENRPLFSGVILARAGFAPDDC